MSQDQGASMTISPRPHMPEAAVSFLEKCLKSSKCYLEYGSGGSTRLAVSLGVQKVFSVESDRRFAKAVCQQIEKDNRLSTFDMTIADVGETGKWGMPVNADACDRWPLYPLGVWDKIAAAGDVPDVILIDGRFRVACFLASILKAKAGATILFDDYLGRRKRYGVVEAFVPLAELVDRTAVFSVPAKLNLREIAVELAKHCVDPK